MHCNLLLPSSEQDNIVIIFVMRGPIDVIFFLFNRSRRVLSDAISLVGDNKDL